MTGQLLRSSKATAVRYERDKRGELVHMDVKKLGRIPDGGGWRGRGELATNHRSKKDKTVKVGFDYVQKGPTCAGFLARAIAWFTGHGITRIERLNRTLQTEWAYRRAFTTNTERANALAPWIE